MGRQEETLYYVQRGLSYLTFHRFKPYWVSHPRQALKTPRLTQARMWASEVGGVVLAYGV